ncbi:FAD-binding domain-containing protein [Microthyrium microscopicum]|uniref:FAD-binding domain-containing protein n=1 Tax=Microthyrium microscopicum TaxID=703497 RepID=A0A6A6UES8_9PEZI|nr:FAD-binding domain-containing protein [Microthyrium microscopicum]
MYSNSHYNPSTIDLTSLYKNTTTTYWDAANDADVPACAFFPASSKDVSTAIVALAKEPGVPFALKAGGHNWNRGFSSTDGGVLISFRPNLQNITLASDGQTAQVGPGAGWVEVMQKLDKSNKCAVGGRSGDVGVGGYVLQGGISYLTAQYGFASDNVVEYELVTANATILTVNNHTNPDVFWALRGGGNAFGVVTSYTLKAYDINQVWGGERTYGPDQLDKINSALTNFISGSQDPLAAIILDYVFVAENQTNQITVAYFYHGPTPSSVFETFMSIPYLADTTRTQRYPELLDTQVTSALGLRTSNVFNSLPNMPSTNMTSYLDWHWKQASDATLLSSRQAYGIELLSMALQPIPVALQRASGAHGAGALSLDPNNGDKLWIEYDVGWTKDAGDDILPQQLKSIADDALAYQKETYAGVNPTSYVSGDLSVVPYNPLFMNDAQYTQPVLRSYGQEAYNKLWSLHKRLDPQGFLTSRQNGFFF